MYRWHQRHVDPPGIQASGKQPAAAAQHPGAHLAPALPALPLQSPHFVSLAPAVLKQLVHAGLPAVLRRLGWQLNVPSRLQGPHRRSGRRRSLSGSKTTWCRRGQLCEAGARLACSQDACGAAGQSRGSPAQPRCRFPSRVGLSLVQQVGCGRETMLALDREATNGSEGKGRPRTPKSAQSSDRTRVHGMLRERFVLEEPSEACPGTSAQCCPDQTSPGPHSAPPLFPSFLQSIAATRPALPSPD